MDFNYFSRKSENEFGFSTGSGQNRVWNLVAGFENEF